MGMTDNYGDGGMPRVTLRIPQGQLDEIEKEVELGRYPNQSEFIRDANRRSLARSQPAEPASSWGEM